jgi:hypothetical protein
MVKITAGELKDLDRRVKQLTVDWRDLVERACAIKARLDAGTGIDIDALSIAMDLGRAFHFLEAEQQRLRAKCAILFAPNLRFVN